jgi:hypothetical protein
MKKVVKEPFDLYVPLPDIDGFPGDCGLNILFEFPTDTDVAADLDNTRDDVVEAQRLPTKAEIINDLALSFRNAVPDGKAAIATLRLDEQRFSGAALLKAGFKKVGTHASSEEGKRVTVFFRAS